MPRPIRKAAAKATKPKPTTEKKNMLRAKKKVHQPEENESFVANPVDRIYKTITLENDDIEDGLWVIRKIGNGRYEAVNLSTVAHEDISSEENEARMASVPESVEVFRASHKSLKEITVKLDRAVFTASGKVFRFIKLPLELRYRIYDFALISKPGTSLYPEHPPNREPPLALGLLATCRSINEECMKFLWKNTFNLSFPSMKCLKLDKQLLIQNIRHVTCTWTGSYTKDNFIFGIIASCRNLETLEINLNAGCVERSSGYSFYSRKPQHLHQDDISIRKFSRSNGFDKLVSLRHLKKVVVSKTHGFTASIRDGTVTEAEVKTFEKFLIKKLTAPPLQQVAPPVVLDHLPSTSTRQSTRIQKLKDAKPVKYVPDPVSDDEEDALNEDAHNVGDDDNDEFDENVMPSRFLQR